MTTSTTALAIRSDQSFWDERQLAALSQLGLQRAPQGDLAVFFHQAKRTGLDPFARQIYMIERRGRYGIQTSIDGFRVIADRACAQRGWVRSEEETIWYDGDGSAFTEWLRKGAPAAARYTCVVITPNGPARYSAVARFDEYSAGGPMWTKMPALMVAKCAEALALRKAFPQDLSGLYTDDEMAQAGPAAPAAGTVTAPEAKRRLVKAAGGDVEVAKRVWGDRGSSPISEDELFDLLDIADEDAVEKAATEVVEAETVALDETTPLFEEADGDE